MFSVGQMEYLVSSFRLVYPCYWSHRGVDCLGFGFYPVHGWFSMWSSSWREVSACSTVGSCWGRAGPRWPPPAPPWTSRPRRTGWSHQSECVPVHSMATQLWKPPVKWQHRNIWYHVKIYFNPVISNNKCIFKMNLL